MLTAQMQMHLTGAETTDQTYEGLKLWRSKKGGMLYFADYTLGETHNPIGPDAKLFSQFKQKHHLREAKGNYDPQWLAMLRPETRKVIKSKGYHTYSRPIIDAEWLAQVGYPELITERMLVGVVGSLADHTKFFNSPQGYVWTTQPYYPELENYKLFEVAANRYGLFASISYSEAWHYPGCCPLIALSNYALNLEK